MDFLSVTAPYAEKIYPLAREPMLNHILTSQRQFTISINPDDGVAKLVMRDEP